MMPITSCIHPPRYITTTATVHPAGLDLRQVDSLLPVAKRFILPVCGESCGTHERWQRHVRYQQMVERKDGYPVETSHLALESRFETARGFNSCRITRAFCAETCRKLWLWWKALILSCREPFKPCTHTIRRYCVARICRLWSMYAGTIIPLRWTSMSFTRSIYQPRPVNDA
jgi:hypothetical protein